MPDRGDHDLLDRAELLFTHYRHAGEHQRDQRDDQHDHAGDVKIPRLEILVEPGTRLQRHAGRSGRLTRRSHEASVQHDFTETTGDLPGIVEHDARRVGVRSVHDHLERRGPAGAEILPEALVHPQDGFDQPTIDEVPGLFFPIDVSHHIEVAGTHESRNQLAAGPAVVEVEYRGRNVRDVRGDGITEHQRLHERHRENHDPHSGITEDLDEFLDQHLHDPLEHHCLTPSSS